MLLELYEDYIQENLGQVDTKALFTTFVPRALLALANIQVEKNLATNLDVYAAIKF